MATKNLIPKRYKWALCISHDVDHLRHYANLNLLKFWGVSFVELVKGRSTAGNFASIVKNSFGRKNDSWNQTEVLASVNKQHKMPATFFFAVKKGRGIDYGYNELKEAVRRLRGFEIGVHGQNHTSIAGVKEELKTMEGLLGKKPAGIRMHYLSWQPETVGLIKGAGYVYDSTAYSETLSQPEKGENGLIEIPFHIMDTYLFSPFYKNFTLEQAKDYTMKLINQARIGKKVLHILFHLRHLAPEFQRQREYYLWLLDYVKKDKTCYKISCSEIAKKLRCSNEHFLARARK